MPPLLDEDDDDRELPPDDLAAVPDLEEDRALLPDLLVPDLLELPEDLDEPPELPPLLADLDVPEDFEPPAVFDPDEDFDPPSDLDLPDEPLVLREAEPPEELLLEEDLLDEPDPFEVFPNDLDAPPADGPERFAAPLFDDDDALFDDEDEEPLFDAADFFVLDDPPERESDVDRDEPVEPPRFVPLCEPTPPVISAAVDAAPITAPFAAPVAISATTLVASSTTFVIVLLPDDLFEPDVLLLVFAAILLASFFCAGALRSLYLYSASRDLTRVR